MSAAEELNVRRQLEEIAARSREESATESTADVASITARRIQVAQEERGRQLKAELARQGEDLAAGRLERPYRISGEDWDSYLARLREWEATPAGVAYALSKRGEEEAEAERQRLAQLDRRLRDAGIPVVFSELATSPDLEETEAVQEVKRGKFRVLVLAGGVGVGKSVAAAHWLLMPCLPGHFKYSREMSPMSRHSPALWVSAARLSRWRRYDDDEMAKLIMPARLVIDDLYTEFADSKGSFLVTLDEVISERVANKRPTVMTTNLDVNGFRERYGERIADRIRESGRFVALAGESMRRKR